MVPKPPKWIKLLKDVEKFRRIFHLKKKLKYLIFELKNGCSYQCRIKTRRVPLHLRQKIFVEAPDDSKLMIWKNGLPLAHIFLSFNAVVLDKGH